MIQIYKPSNTDYASNGDMTLQPSEAEIQAKSHKKTRHQTGWNVSRSHGIHETLPD